MATPMASDMAQFFDFTEAAMPDVPQEDAEHVTKGQASEEVPAFDQPAEFNSDFSSWLPRYQKPSHPCDYCRSKSLECFIYNADGSESSGCSPCNALFRPCSFKNPEMMPARNRKGALDTLDVVGEDDERCFGGLTGRKAMRSLGHVGPIEDENLGDDRPRKGAAAVRFPRPAVKILKDWMIRHIDHPYPTEEEKDMLKQQTGLTIGQISNWMANTRRRQKSRTKRSASPSIRPSTEVIDIPPGRTWESLNPFERWKHSPPENEPAPMTAIAQAVETFDPPESRSLSGSYRKETSNSSTGSFSVFKAPSISSLETGFTNMSSGSLGSLNSAYSHGSRHSLGSMNSLKSKERRRRRRLPTRAPKQDSDAGPRMFQCTFCTDRFKSKYDWSRHEKTLHLSLEKWICAPLGEVIVDKATGKRKCVFCDALDPTEEHLAAHNRSGCYEKGIESRTFYRKDHLRQHLRLMHNCKMTASMESWKSEAQLIKSRCGFCDAKFEVWQDRVDHLTKEFRNGAQMRNWKGCRGLEPHVAVHVTNAMPPYLIGNESQSPFPFSASDSSSLWQANLKLGQKDLEYLIPSDPSPTNDLFVAYQDSREQQPVGPIVLSNAKQYSASESPEVKENATCWEVLTLRLGRFAREHIAQHGASSVTDEMLQREARRILYDGADDPWDQTSADNPEWLTLFKKAHGLEAKGPVPGINSHHEVFEDLGIRHDATLDPSFDIGNFDVLSMHPDDPTRSLAFECSLSGTVDVSSLARRQLSSGQASPYPVPPLASPMSASASPSSSASRALPFSHTDPENLTGLFAPIKELTCTGPGGPCYDENGEIGFSTQKSKSASPSACASQKRTYWPDSNTASMAPFPVIAEQRCTQAGDPLMPPLTETACTKAGDPMFDDILEMPCTLAGDAILSSLTETPCTLSGDALQFPPAWNEMPVTSAATANYMNLGMNSDVSAAMSMPITTVGGGGFGQQGQFLRWDDAELNFAMDMDADLDLNMNVLGKC